MQEKGLKIDAVTYTSMIHWLSNSGDVDGAVKIWEEMKDQCCCPTVVSYTAYLKILFVAGESDALLRQVHPHISVESIIDEEAVEIDEQGAKTQDEGTSRAEGPPSFMGKHRLAAAISHLHNEINLIQEELNELETLGESSLVCNELISSVESIPDPLLPMTKGPVDDSWERWFRGAHNLRTRWI
ncbi:hypothetical protein LWI29_011955 [Acer saccharum]|uniref:G protein gamma domain-containing protein n=1 Tax=Acer saccharum TaxID=4024 RepID=A0AA39T650_ACESA|nr:hypothetical protein LWI29_011955 [Acer saccharum]